MRIALGNIDNANLVFYEAIWNRPIELDEIEEALLLLAETRPRGPVILEARAENGRIHYYIGCDQKYLWKVRNCFSSQKVRFKQPNKNARRNVTSAKELRIGRPSLSLNVELTESVIRSTLAAMAQVRKGETAVVQIVLGRGFSPTMVSSQAEDPATTLLDRITGNIRTATGDTLKSMRKKAEQYSFAACVRIGATGTRANQTINSICTAIRTMSSAGVIVSAKNSDHNHMNCEVAIPWRFPLRLSVKELSCLMLLPLGEEAYPGVAGTHPRLLLPPDWYMEPKLENEKARWFARAFARSEDEKLLSISPRDSLEHTYILGPTGSGKSTAMLNLIMADINAGRSVMVIDPKADLVNDVLARIPSSRMQDVVVIDPSDSKPVGFNPLTIHGGQSPELVADSILSAFQEIFAENWGIRSQDILSAALLTLARTKNATLMWLPTLLTDEQFRDKVIKEGAAADRIGLIPFWEQFNSLKEGERRAQIDPVLNKMRQLMYRPGLRNILGQSHPKFDLMDLFFKRRIILVPLNKGLIGSDSAKLLGSLLVSIVWTMALSRANIPKDKRHIVSLYIDELQDYVSLPTSFADALAQARGLGLGITCANQYRAQLRPEIREGVDNNCRNKIIFGLSAGDALPYVSSSNELETQDFVSLPRYHIYTKFMSGGKQTGFVSGKTLAPTEPLRLPVEAKAISQNTYGKAAEEVEEEIIGAIMVEPSTNPPPRDDLRTSDITDAVVGKIESGKSD